MFRVPREFFGPRWPDKHARLLSPFDEVDSSPDWRPTITIYSTLREFSDNLLPLFYIHTASHRDHALACNMLFRRVADLLIAKRRASLRPRLTAYSLTFLPPK